MPSLAAFWLDVPGGGASPRRPAVSAGGTVGSSGRPQARACGRTLGWDPAPRSEARLAWLGGAAPQLASRWGTQDTCSAPRWASAYPSAPWRVFHGHTPARRLPSAERVTGAQP